MKWGKYSRTWIISDSVQDRDGGVHVKLHDALEFALTRAKTVDSFNFYVRRQGHVDGEYRGHVRATWEVSVTQDYHEHEKKEQFMFL